MSVLVAKKKFFRPTNGLFGPNFEFRGFGVSKEDLEAASALLLNGERCQMMDRISGGAVLREKR